MDAIDWVDLPDDNYIDVLGYDTPNTQELNTLIQKYNKIPKDQVSTLSCRIRKLNLIIDYIQMWTTQRLDLIDKKKHLLWISEISLKKRNYLSALQEIYENNKHEEPAQIHYHTNTCGLKDPTKTVVFLNNQRFFSLKLREYWGDFWFETLDPCHRRLTPFLDQWRIIKNTNINTPHFFLWLETQHTPKYVPHVSYLQGENLEKCRLAIKDGLFWEKRDNEWALANFNDPKNRYLFSINIQEEIYAAEESTGVSHSSFTCGRPVLGAGLLQIHEGVITSLALESGHYMPTSEIGYQILKIFEEKGAHFPEKLELIFFYDRNKYIAEIAIRDLETFEQFKIVIELVYQQKMRCCHESKTK